MKVDDEPGLFEYALTVLGVMAMFFVFVLIKEKMLGTYSFAICGC